MMRMMTALGFAVAAISSAGVAGGKPPKHCDRDHARPANPYGSVLVSEKAPAPVAAKSTPDSEKNKAEPADAATSAGGGGAAPVGKISRATPEFRQFRSC